MAAGLLIDMLSDVRIIQIECETADDLVIRWNEEGGVTEYVQVKTTDDDSKWSITELVTRTPKGNVGSSIAEKSLACDVNEGGVAFRIVTLREVRADLRLFKVPRDKRAAIALPFAALVSRFASKHKTFKSAKARTLGDWAQRLLWQVENSSEALERKNLTKLLQLAEAAGEAPSFSDANDLYADLIKKAMDAGDASRVEDPEAKVLARSQILEWWETALQGLRQASKKTLKVYQVTTKRFFSEFHNETEPQLKRGVSAYDAEFDGEIWRRDQLVEYLLRWLPEVSLPARVLAEYDYLDAQELTKNAVAAYEAQRVLDDRQLVAELLLHAILRHYHKSEPIACKLFYQVKQDLRSTSAHIVPALPRDELWLGHSRLVTIDAFDDVLSTLTAHIEQSLDRELLAQERRIIVQLREPEHLRASTVESALKEFAKVDDLLSILRVPVLIAYDSAVLSAGFDAGYVAKLKGEAEAAYLAVKSNLPAALRDIQIHVFLVPVECAKSLTASFGSALRK